MQVVKQNEKNTEEYRSIQDHFFIPPYDLDDFKSYGCKESMLEELLPLSRQTGLNWIS